MTTTALNTQVGGDHYKKLAIQPMEFSCANMWDAAAHTALKYITRYRDKAGVVDLEKAQHCIELRKQLVTGTLRANLAHAAGCMLNPFDRMTPKITIDQYIDANGIDRYSKQVDALVALANFVTTGEVYFANDCVRLIDRMITEYQHEMRNDA